MTSHSRAVTGARATFALPKAADPRWKIAPRHGSEEPTPYLSITAQLASATDHRLRWLTDTTRIIMLADGFPGRLRDGHVVVHPLDGRYLLEALMAEQTGHPRRRLHAAIARTAHAIVGRAEPLGDALVMRYVDTASSMAEGRTHVSSLAQAYYAIALTRAAHLLGDDELQRAGDRFFEALRIPAEDGGTLYRNGRDTAFALVPSRPRDYVLNGWLSTLVSLHSYAELRNSDPARRLLRSSLRTMRRFLPLYDVPELHLSRYGLTGPLLLRLGFTGAPGSGVRISRLRVAIPGEGEIALPSRPGGRWTPRAYPEDAAVEPGRRGAETLVPHGRGLRLVAVLSRAPFPRPNRLRFHVRAPRDMSIAVTAHIGRYDPMTSATLERTWVTLATVAVPQGSRDMDVALAHGPIGLFAYPTNFTRGGPEKKVNTYHGTHITRLRELADATGSADLRAWADRWLRYTRQWGRHSAYADGICWTPEGKVQ